MCVSDTKAVESVLFGPQGVEESLAEGMTIVDSSTISPSATRKFAERVAAEGVRYVDAPMTGSKVAAEAGTLIFIVGGDEAVIESLKPLFAAMGKVFFRMGETGKGQSAKLVMNLQIALIYEGFAEGLTLATKLGVDVEKLMPVIQASMIRSGVVDYKAPFVLKRDFTPNFPLASDAQRHSPDAGGCQRSSRQTAGPRNRGRDLRNGHRRWTSGSGLRRHPDPAGKVGWGRSKRRFGLEPFLCGRGRLARAAASAKASPVTRAASVR